MGSGLGISLKLNHVEVAPVNCDKNRPNRILGLWHLQMSPVQASKMCIFFFCLENAQRKYCQFQTLRSSLNYLLQCNFNTSPLEPSKLQIVMLQSKGEGCSMLGVGLKNV